jgi:hypothetical protein
MINIYDTITINSEHAIEFGKATWDNTVNTIRRRKNNSTGTYDPISSSEIPIDEGFIDIGRLTCECLKRDLIPKSDMADLLKELLESAQRQGFTISIT